MIKGYKLTAIPVTFSSSEKVSVTQLSKRHCSGVFPRQTDLTSWQELYQDLSLQGHNQVLYVYTERGFASRRPSMNATKLHTN